MEDLLSRMTLTEKIGQMMQVERGFIEDNEDVTNYFIGSILSGGADILFGDDSPTGKLSHSWPRSMDQIPLNRNDSDYEPLFPYGFGLGY